MSSKRSLPPSVSSASGASSSSSTSLWSCDTINAWKDALDAYPERVKALSKHPLVDLDILIRNELPAVVSARSPPHLISEEISKIAQWKMSRGKFRPRNQGLVDSNSAEKVKKVTEEAIAIIDALSADCTLDQHEDAIRRAIKCIADELDGIGPATASAILAAARPKFCCFFDESMSQQIPTIPSKVAYTVPFCMKYCRAVIEKARQLGLSPREIDLALWSESVKALVPATPAADASPSNGEPHGRDSKKPRAKK